jgi:hypothetical protein
MMAPGDRRTSAQSLQQLLGLAASNRLRDKAVYDGFVGWPGGSSGGPVTAWVWQPVPEPALEALPASGRSWETTRYGDYRDFLARRAVGESFGRATAFLRLAASAAPAVAGVSAPAAS